MFLLKEPVLSFEKKTPTQPWFNNDQIAVKLKKIKTYPLNIIFISI